MSQRGEELYLPAYRHVLQPAWLLECAARFRTAGAIILTEMEFDAFALICCYISSTQSSNQAF
jgi:hypothetical protein